MKKLFIVLIFLVGCRKAKQEFTSQASDNDLTVPVVEKGSASKADVPPSIADAGRLDEEYSKRYKEKFPGNRPYIEIYLSDECQDLRKSIDNLINCNDDEFIHYYKQSIELDFSSMGIVERFKTYGLFSGIFVASRNPGSLPENNAKCKIIGSQLYKLLLRVDKLPDTDEFHEAKVRIFQGASNTVDEFGHMMGQEDDTAHKSYEFIRKDALEKFKVFE